MLGSSDHFPLLSGLHVVTVLSTDRLCRWDCMETLRFNRPREPGPPRLARP